jgi:putative DNA primase/helicase
MTNLDAVKGDLFEAGMENAEVEHFIRRYDIRPRLTPQVQATDEEIERRLLEFAADDVGNAEAFIYLHGGNFRHSRHAGWFYYTGTHYAGEDKDAAKVLWDAVIDTLRRRRLASARVGEVARAVYAATTQTHKHVRDCVAILTQKPALSIHINDFNAADDKINCANGVVNLRTGEIEPHSNQQYFTYCMPEAYNPVADQSEIWAFLDAALDGGHATAEKAQLFFGYCLTGDKRYEKFAYMTGAPRAGKGTMKEALEKLCGSLVKAGAFATFTRKREESANNFDLAALKDARMVICDEGDKNSRLNEGRVKQIAGGGLINASFKHRDAFNFEPKFKLIFISNHNIDADAGDDAFWSRVVLFSFPHGHAGTEDLSIKARLTGKETRAGWLTWLIAGAMKFYAGGYKRFEGTDEMREMLEKRREELDTQGRWFNEECEAVAGEVTPITDLRTSFETWGKPQGERAKKSEKEFADWFERHGFKTKAARVNGKVVKVREGVRLLRAPDMAGLNV